MDNNLIITPETNLFDLLKEYPQLEDILIDSIPVFKKLTNPVLRKTIISVTNLRQAAEKGDIPLDKLINRLRFETGHDSPADIKGEKKSDGSPTWLDSSKIAGSLDARPIINSGGHPLDTVIRGVQAMKKGKIYELITPFLPVPLIDKVEAMGFESWSTQTGADLFKTYFISR